MAFDQSSTSNQQLVIRLIPLAYLAALVGAYYAAHVAGTGALFRTIALPWSLATGGLMVVGLAAVINTLLLTVVTNKIASR